MVSILGMMKSIFTRIETQYPTLKRLEKSENHITKSKRTVLLIRKFVRSFTRQNTCTAG